MRDMPKVFDTDYILYDDNGMVKGIKDDAPDWAKQEFEEFMKDTDPEPDADGNVTLK
jgi:hypothetical protein